MELLPQRAHSNILAIKKTKQCDSRSAIFVLLPNSKKVKLLPPEEYSDLIPTWEVYGKDFHDFWDIRAFLDPLTLVPLAAINALRNRRIKGEANTCPGGHELQTFATLAGKRCVCSLCNKVAE